MYKQVMLLGLLLERPMYGQQIREVIELHHGSFAELIKKPTIYYQLEQLTREGFLEVRRESVEAPGPGAGHETLAQRERDVYYITEAGREHFYKLLRETLLAYIPAPSGLDVSLFFLQTLPTAESIGLLEERRRRVTDFLTRSDTQLNDHHTHDRGHDLVNDHTHTLLHAELDWIARTIASLRTEHRATE